MLRFVGFMAYTVKETFEFLMNVMKDDTLPHGIRGVIPWVLWAIWKNKNDTVISWKKEDLLSLVQKAHEDAQQWQEVNVVTLEVNHVSCSGMFKCNIKSLWVNSSLLMFGGAWIVRDHLGQALFHSRETFIPSLSQFKAELHYLIWAMTSMYDIYIRRVEVVSDNGAMMEALLKPR